MIYMLSKIKYSQWPTYLWMFWVAVEKTVVRSRCFLDSACAVESHSVGGRLRFHPAAHAGYSYRRVLDGEERCSANCGSEGGHDDGVGAAWGFAGQFLMERLGW
jgi:hypothetical protein